MSLDNDSSLFKGLDQSLKDAIEEHYFNEPREFRTLIEVLTVLGKADTSGRADMLSVLKDENPAYSKLLFQQKIVYEVIEQVVMFQHGGLNSTVETMTDVLKEYNRGRKDVRDLRSSLAETQDVLTAKKSGQISMKDLWLKKVEAEQTLRLVQDVEYLRDVAPIINRLIQRRQYFCAVKILNSATILMFSDDMVAVRGLSQVRQTLMETKGHLLEDIVLELQSVIVGDYSSGSNASEELVDDQESTLDGEHFGARTVKSSISTGDISELGSFELSNLDEAGEAALVDRSSSLGLSLFLRYLVRAVGELHYEQDAERMVLDSTKSRYLDVVRQLRERASLRRTKILQDLFRQADRDITGKIGLYEADLFTEYIKSLLEVSRSILTRLLYVLRLLSIMRKLRTGIENPYEYVLQVTNRDAVLSLWTHIEVCITRELQIHFVEKDIEDISDAVRNKKSSSDDEQDIDSDFQPVKGTLDYVFDEIGTSTDDGAAIFTTSTRYAAPVYLPVVNFTDEIKKIMIKEGVIGERRAGQCQAVLVMLREFLGTDLVPLIQLSVNSSLREIQVNNLQFTVPSSSTGYDYQHGHKSQENHILICGAASICSTAANPLFRYWLQLPQHNEMVLTILERLIIGFIAAAKEEMESSGWSLIGYEENYRKKVGQCIRENILFLRYRASIYGSNINVIDKSDVGIVLSASSGQKLGSTDSAGSSDMALRGLNTLGDDDATCSIKELSLWSPFWDIGPASIGKYPTFVADSQGNEVSNRMIKDFVCVRTIASIIRGCDWLANELCCQCAGVIKTDSSRLNDFESTDSKASEKASIASKLVRVSAIRNELLKRNALINHTVQQSAKDLSRLASEGLATLRAEVECACFHFLYPLRSQKFTTDMAVFEGESHVSNLNQYIFQFLKATANALPPSAIAVIFSPLCKLIPHILMAHIRSACDIGSAPVHLFDRTKPNKIIVAAEKVVGQLFESAGVSQEILYDLQEIIASEFERVRRYVTLLDMNAGDLHAYIKANSRHYTADEYYTLYSRVHDGVPRSQFDKIWANISTSRRELTARFN
jgi:hypothetical protein